MIALSTANFFSSLYVKGYSLGSGAWDFIEFQVMGIREKDSGKFQSVVDR